MSDNPKSRSLAGIAGIVALATLISKVFGLVRQQAIAAAFGVGVAVDAYNYAYIIPGFLLILLGGINGPFHSAIVSVLAKREKAEAAPLVETITTLVGGILLLVTIVLIIFAPNFIDLVAPGLNQVENGAQVKAIATEQLQIMAFMAVLAGLIGIGFGTLNSADMYWLPSVSPLFSSVTVIGGIAILAVQLGQQITLPKYALIGGQVLAWGTLIGAILQWIIQVVAQWKAGLGALRLRFEFNRPGVKDVLKVMGPATLSSGMLQINLYTDLFFASFIPQAAAAMNYSGLLIQTPLGIISNVILVPLLPIFSRLTDPKDWDELKGRIRQGLLLTGLTMLPLSAIMVTLAYPIVRVIYERYAFNQSASQLVGSVLIASSLGMFVYLGRDVLVRVFYALGDGTTPFRISIVNIFINALLDFLLVGPFGAPGLVLATVGVNLTSFIALLWFLNKRLNGLPWKQTFGPLIYMAIASVFTGATSWGVSYLWNQLFTKPNFLILLLQLVVAGGAGILVFSLFASQLKIPEVNQLKEKIMQKIRRVG